jgi:type I restriction enzyme S subunit
LKRYTVHPGDVIVTIMGTTGRTAVVPHDIPTAITTKHLATITLNKAKALPAYLAHALRLDPDVYRQIEARSRGAIMPGLNISLIKSLELRLPPLALQAQFVRALETIESMKSSRIQSLAEANTLFEALSDRAFRGEL